MDYVEGPLLKIQEAFYKGLILDLAIKYTSTLQ
jgi:hypothetical protein